MDPRRNPFAPGAGHPPPELAGRDDIIERASIALDRIMGGRAARSFIFYGLRGVGKTVLLNRIMNDADGLGFATVMLEAPEGRSLPSQLAPHLRALFLRLNRTGKAKDLFDRSLKALAGFISAVKVKYNDVEVSMDVKPESGLADSGDLEIDLRDLVQAAGEAARAAGTAIVIFIDELQYFEEKELGALITALHHASQKQLPVTLLAAGLPTLLGQMGRAKSYAERLFEFVPVGPLNNWAVEVALRKPVEAAHAKITNAAIEEIRKETEGYPYFVQEWGKHAWNSAVGDTINTDDSSNATFDALAELDASFFRVRFDRLTPAEKEYLHAMAHLGVGSHRSGEIAAALQKPVSSCAPVRNSLIKKGMIFSPAHGDTAFTVPLFDGFLLRNLGK
jgi:AAA ATPase domain